MSRFIYRVLAVCALALLPYGVGFAQATDNAKSDLKASETLADELEKQMNSELSGFGSQLACQAQCQFADTNGNCQRKYLRTEQEHRSVGCSVPYYGTRTERQNVDYYMCNERIPRNDWTTTVPCNVCTQSVSYYCSGTGLVTRITCAETGQIISDSPPDVDHPWCGCSSTWQGFSCSGSTGVYSNYCYRDNRLISQSYSGEHPSCVPPPAQATLQSCNPIYVFKCGKYHCAYTSANMGCSNLAPGQQCNGAGTFDDGYITLNAGNAWCSTANTYGCCTGW